MPYNQNEIDDIAAYISSPEGKGRQDKYMEEHPKNPSGITKLNWHPFVTGIVEEFIAKRSSQDS